MDLALILSVAVLIAAPLLARAVKRMPSLKAGLDGFVLLIVIGLITITLLPEALKHGGLIGLLVAVTGFGLPWIAEFLFHKSEEMTHRVLMLIAALALVIHSASDGALLALVHDATEGGPFLAAGIVLHRIGVAVAVWWLLRPILTTVGGIAVLVALGAMTIVGYFLVYLADEWYNIAFIGYWQAFAAGSLFHIVMHPLDDHNTAPTANTQNAHRIGSALGIIFLAALIYAHYAQHGPIAAAHLHDDHHDLTLLANIAQLIAPISLLAIIAAFVYGRLRDRNNKAAYKAVVTITPWTMVCLLLAAMLEELLPGTLPTASGGSILLVIWLTLTAGVIIHTGARSFFAVLMPRITNHSHSHS